jgi:biopolymer transport protein ExbB
MSPQNLSDTHSLWSLVTSGGFAMYPLVICSLLVWAVIFERIWRFRKLGHGLKAFHLEAINVLLRGDRESLRSLCNRNPELPTARLLLVALERQDSRDKRLQARWMEAIDRKRQILNLELRENLWVLGTIGAAAPFIGLFGTVVGILRSFQEMARTGSGGFAVVASGISESLIATASGIVVAVIAVMAFNAFQTRWTTLVLTIRIQTEELTEMLIANEEDDRRGT